MALPHHSREKGLPGHYALTLRAAATPGWQRQHVATDVPLACPVRTHSLCCSPPFEEGGVRVRERVSSEAKERHLLHAALPALSGRGVPLPLLRGADDLLRPAQLPGPVVRVPDWRFSRSRTPPGARQRSFGAPNRRVVRHALAEDHCRLGDVGERRHIVPQGVLVQSSKEESDLLLRQGGPLAEGLGSLAEVLAALFPIVMPDVHRLNGPAIRSLHVVKRLLVGVDASRGGVRLRCSLLWCPARGRQETAQQLCS
mmetsp:Transcript_36527/g.82566  ORF Transcript_36527/g.82566 Transcript_36527/m.82566 type:complete len:256 (-) Transcript_36527:396-1163(-)